MVISYRFKIVDFDVLIRGFQDIPTFLQCCEDCPSFGATWACPPFPADEMEWTARVNRVLLVQAVAKDEADATIDELFCKARERVNLLLRQMELICGGRMMSAGGGCTQCEKCSRKEGNACRFPEIRRPALEAYGFNVCAITEHFFGTEIKWSRKRKSISEATLVGAVAYKR